MASYRFLVDILYIICSNLNMKRTLFHILSSNATLWFSALRGIGFVGFDDSDTTGTHYSDVIMKAMVSQITCVSNVCSTVYSGADHRKHQSSASVAFVRGIHQWPLNSPHKWPVTRNMSPLDDVIMARQLRVDHGWVDTYTINIKRSDIRYNSCLNEQSYNILPTNDFTHVV